MRQVSLEISSELCHALLMKELYDFMARREMTQVQFAKFLNVHQGQLNHWLHGRRFPNAENLKMISKRTGISLDRLVSEL